MRMISQRDERILGQLSRHAGNDLDIVQKALDEINHRAVQERRKLRIEDAFSVIDRLLEEEEPPRLRANAF